MHTSNFVAVLRLTPFRNVWIAQLLSQITLNMLTFVLGVLVYEQTKSNTAVSLLYLAFGLPAAFFGIISGVFADRFDKKTLLVVTTLVRVGLTGLLIIFPNNLYVIYSVLALVSLISQFFVPAEAALIPHYVPPKLLLSANSLFTLTFYSAIIGGFVAGGPLLDFLKAPAIIYLLMFFFLLSTVFLLFLPKTPKRSDLSKLTFGLVYADVVDCFVYIKEKVLVKQAIILMTVAQVIITIFAILGPGFADRILSVKLTDASIVILAPAAIGMIVGAIVIGQIGAMYSRRLLIKLGVFLSAFLILSITAIIHTPQSGTLTNLFEHIFSISIKSGILPIAVVLFFLLGFANSLIDVTSNTVIQEQTTDAVRGKVYGLLASLFSGVAILPVIISGLVADYFGIGKILLSLGVLLLALGIVIEKRDRQLRKQV